MSKSSKEQWQPANPESLGKHFSRLGWIGFWIQVVLLIIPIFLLLYVMFISSPESAQRKGINLGNYLSYGSLVVMLFTTFWFFRYTRLAKKIADPKLCPAQSSVIKTVWIGLGASCLGVFFSVIMMINTVFRMLIILLATPQTGIPFAAPGGDPGTVLSAIDAVSLTSLVLMLAAELIVMSFSLWLLFRLTRPATEDADD